MGLHISAPGLTLSPDATLGQVQLVTSAEAAVLGLANLVNWWRASNAKLSGGSMTWTDRKSGAQLVGSSPPAIETVSDEPALRFIDGAPSFLDGPASIPLTNNFTWIIRLRPIGPLATSVIFASNRGADGDGGYMYAFDDGSFSAAIRAGQQVNSGGGRLVADQTAIIDWSWNGTQHKLGKGGAVVQTGTAPTGGAAPAATTGWRFGRSPSNALGLRAQVFDVLQFNADLHDGVGDHAQQLATVIAKL